MNFLTDEEFDEVMEYLEGTRYTLLEGLENCGYEGKKFTVEQIIFRKENYKRCRRCGTWIGKTDQCSC